MLICETFSSTFFLYLNHLYSTYFQKDFKSLTEKKKMQSKHYNRAKQTMPHTWTL